MSKLHSSFSGPVRETDVREISEIEVGKIYMSRDGSVWSIHRTLPALSRKEGLRWMGRREHAQPISQDFCKSGMIRDDGHKRSKDLIKEMPETVY